MAGGGGHVAGYQEYLPSTLFRPRAEKLVGMVDASVVQIWKPKFQIAAKLCKMFSLVVPFYRIRYTSTRVCMPGVPRNCARDRDLRR
eukprot:2863046-Rhodomonas_salina.1